MRPMLCTGIIACPQLHAAPEQNAHCACRQTAVNRNATLAPTAANTCNARCSTCSSMTNCLCVKVQGKGLGVRILFFCWSDLNIPLLLLYTLCVCERERERESLINHKMFTMEDILMEWHLFLQTALSPAPHETYKTEIKTKIPHNSLNKTCHTKIPYSVSGHK